MAILRIKKYTMKRRLNKEETVFKIDNAGDIYYLAL